MGVSEGECECEGVTHQQLFPVFIENIFQCLLDVHTFFQVL